MKFCLNIHDFQRLNVQTLMLFTSPFGHHENEINGEMCERLTDGLPWDVVKLVICTIIITLKQLNRIVHMTNTIPLTVNIMYNVCKFADVDLGSEL